MAKQTINIGTQINDGTGDTLRTAGQKINSNFDELYSSTTLDASFTQASFNRANSSTILAQSSFNTANSSTELAQSSFNTANSSTVLAQSSFNTANSSTVLAQAAFNQANTILGLGNFKISGSTLGTQGEDDGWGGSWMYLAPAGEGWSGISIPSATASTDGGNLQIYNNNVDSGSIQLSTYTGSWDFNNDGTITFPDSSVQTGASISIAELKVLVAAAETYADFQTAIANL